MARKIYTFMIAVMFVMIFFQMIQTWWIPGPKGNSIIHIFFALWIVILNDMIKHHKNKLYMLWSCLLLILSFVASLHFYSNQIDIMMRVGNLSYPDFLAGSILLLLVLIYCAKIFGIAFSALGLLFIAYAFASPYLPGILGGPDVSVNRLVSHMTIRMYGEIVNISASFLFLFVIFGALLGVSGGDKFILKVARFVQSITKGGVGVLTICTSAVVSMFTGTGAANTGITGPLTIPLMKKNGYTSNTAAAVESVATLGGSITPPILGATAFIMSDFLNISYLTIVVATIIPAILFYLGVFMYVLLFEQKHGLNKAKDDDAISQISWPILIKGSILFIVPMLTLIILMMEGFSMRYCAFWTVFATIVLSVILRTEKNIKVWINGIESGVKIAVGISLACVILDMMVAVLSVTSLGLRFGSIISDISGDNLIVAVLIGLISSYILGLGMPAVAVYIVTATLIAPVFVQLGMEPIVAHLIFYIGATIGNITPPIASGVLVATQIAGGNYFRASNEAMLLGNSIFILPIYLFLAPEIVTFNGSTANLIGSITFCALGIIFMQVATVGYFSRQLNYWERIVGFLAFFFILVALYLRSFFVETFAILFIIACIGYHVIATKKSFRAEVAE